MDFFTPTEDELKKALSGNDCAFKHGDMVVFMINKIVEDSAKGFMRLESKVMDGENKDKVYSFFFRNNEWGLKGYVQLMKCFYTDIQILSKEVNLTSAIGKQFVAKARISKKDTVEFTNWDFKQEHSNVPDMAQAMGAPQGVELATNPVNNVLI